MREFFCVFFTRFGTLYGYEKAKNRNGALEAARRKLATGHFWVRWSETFGIGIWSSADDHFKGRKPPTMIEHA